MKLSTNKKARFVVKWFKQQESVDSSNRYSFVPKIVSIWTLIVITTINKLEICQIGVKTTLLNDDFD
jgi:hypothetical protein